MKQEEMVKNFTAQLQAVSYQDMIKQTRVFDERIHLLKSVITISYVVFSLHYTRSSL